MDIKEKIKKIICDELSVADEDVIPEASLTDDLGADSLTMITLIAAFEDELGLDISEEDAKKIKTVQDAYDYIEGKAPKEVPDVNHCGRLADTVCDVIHGVLIESDDAPWGEESRRYIIPEAHLTNDLGFGVAEHAEMIMALDDAFGISISPEGAEKIKTVQDAIDYITRLQQA